MSKAICRSLTQPIREAIIELGRTAARMTMPTPTYQDMVEMCVEPGDIPVLERAYELVGLHHFSPNVRFRDVSGGLENFKLDFRVDREKVKITFPRYCSEGDPARGTLAAQQRIMPAVLKQYYLVGRVRVALEVFDTLNTMDTDDLTIAHLRYHLDWLPAIFRMITPKLVNRYENTSRSRSERAYRAERKEQKDQAIYWSNKLDETSERYHWSLPMASRPLVTEASAAMATIAVLQKSGADIQPSTTGVVIDVKVPSFVTQSGEFEASGFALT